MISWPDWWSWDVGLSSHVLKRMIDRQFGVVDGRTMLDDANDSRADVEPGRWVIETQHNGRHWEVLVEPSPDDELLVVVTAYEVL